MPAAAVVKVAAEPSGGEKLVALGGGFPDFGRAKVAAIGIRVADILNDCDFSIPVQVGYFFQGWVESHIFSDRDELLGFESEPWPEAKIVGVLKRNQGIEAVVSSGQLDKDKHGSILFRSRRSCQGSMGEEGRRELAEGEESDPAGAIEEELAPSGRI